MSDLVEILLSLIKGRRTVICPCSSLSTMTWRHAMEWRFWCTQC